jgi:hypothetical protein
MSLKEMHDLVRLFTSSPPGCVDWEMISQTATGGRIPAVDVEYAANEFLPHVHYRSNVGMVVMERHPRIPTEYQKHRQTMKRLRQGLSHLLSELKRRLGTSDPGEENIHIPPKTEGEPMSITPEVSPDEIMDEEEAEVAPVERQPRGRPPKRSTPGPDIRSYASWLPAQIAEELRQRASIAINRLQQGQIPSFALRTAHVAQVDAEGGSLNATGRVRRRYETKAMRLAKEAALPSGQQHNIVRTPVVQVMQSTTSITPTAESTSTYEPPPFFMATARQFAKSSDE